MIRQNWKGKAPFHERRGTRFRAGNITSNSKEENTMKKLAAILVALALILTRHAGWGH